MFQILSVFNWSLSKWSCSCGHTESIVREMNFSSTNSWPVLGMKGCGHCHSLAIGSPEEHFLSRILLDRELGRPQNKTGHSEEDRKALPPSGIKPLLLGPPVSFLVTIQIMKWQLTEKKVWAPTEELRVVCELIGSTEFVRLTGFISSFNEYFRTVIKQQYVYCEHKGNLQEFKLLCAFLSG
jgi:hypothetical protein